MARRARGGGAMQGEALASGEALDPPADEPLAVYPVSVLDGRLVVEFPG